MYAITLDGKLKWRFRTDKYIAADPVVYRNMLLFGSGDSNLYALDKETGKMVWKLSVAGGEMGSPAVYRDVIYVTNYNNTLLALNPDGTELWRYKTDKPISHRRVCIADDTIYFSCHDWTLNALNLEGKLLWKFRMGGHAFITPAVHDNVIYFGSTDNRFYALNAKTGRKLWDFKRSAYIISDPIIYKGMVYFGCWDCNFYCLDLKGKLIWKYQTSTGNMAVIQVEAASGKRIARFTMPQQTVKKETYTASLDVMPEGESPYTSGGITYLSQEMKKYRKEGKYKA